MKSTIYILLFVVCFSSVKASDTITPQQGIAMLKEVYASWQQESKLLSEKKAFHMNYKLSTTAIEKFGGATNTSEIDLYANPDYSAYISKDMEVYQDKSTKVVVSPADKKITIAASNPKDLNNDILHQFTSLRDTLFSICEIMSVVKLKGGLIELKLSVPKKYLSLYPVEYIRYVFDDKKKELKEVEVLYNGTVKIKKMTIQFLEMDFNYPVSKIAISPNDRIYQNGSLLEKYNTYAVNDLRTKTK